MLKEISLLKKQLEIVCGWSTVRKGRREWLEEREKIDDKGTGW